MGVGGPKDDDEIDSNMLATLLSGKTVSGQKFPLIINAGVYNYLKKAAQEEYASFEIKDAIDKIEPLYNEYSMLRQQLQIKRREGKSISFSELEAIIKKASQYASEIEKLVEEANHLPLQATMEQIAIKKAAKSEVHSSQKPAKTEIPFTPGKAALFASIQELASIEGKKLKHVEVAPSLKIIGYTTLLSEQEFKAKIADAEDFGADAVLKEHLIPVYENQKEEFTGPSNPLSPSLAQELDTLSKDAKGQIQFWSKEQQKKMFKGQAASINPTDLMGHMGHKASSTLQQTANQQSPLPPAPSPKSSLPFRAEPPPIPKRQQKVEPLTPPPRSPLQSRRAPPVPKREQEISSERGNEEMEAALATLRSIAEAFDSEPTVTWKKAKEHGAKEKSSLRLGDRRTPLGLYIIDIDKIMKISSPEVYHEKLKDKASMEQGRAVQAVYTAMSFLKSPHTTNMTQLHMDAHRDPIWFSGQAFDKPNQKTLEKLQELAMLLNFGDKLNVEPKQYARLIQLAAQKSTKTEKAWLE